MLVVLKTVCLFGGIFTAGTILSGGIYSIIPTIQKHFEKEEDVKIPELLLQTQNTENIQEPQTEPIQNPLPTQHEELPIINQQEVAKAEEQRKINETKLQLKAKNTALVVTLNKEVSQLTTTIQTKKVKLKQLPNKLKAIKL